MAYSHRGFTVCLAGGAILLAALPLATATRSAQPGPADTIRVPPGVQVHISGNHAMLSRLGGGANVHGSYDCSCPADAKGQCALTFDRDHGTIACGPVSGNGCSKGCSLTITTLPDTAAGSSHGQAAP